MDHDGDQTTEQVKALFTSVGAQPGPPLGFTADGIARRGRRVRLARWGAGAATSLLVAAALTTTIALTANRDVEPGSPPHPVTTTDVPTTPDVPATTTTPPPTATSTTTTTTDGIPATT